MRLAAVDLGSNSFRVEIAKVDGDQIFSEGSWKETVRLAGGIDENGNLTEEKQTQALEALARIAEKIRNLPLNQIRAVGTQTLRAAKNSREFLEKAEKVLGVKIEILRGREEARLVYEGCSFALPASDERRLIVDIGGASTECVVGRGHEMLAGESFHVGCVNTSVRFFKGGRLSREQFDKAQLAAEVELDGNIRNVLAIGWDAVYGSSGTANAVSLILRDLGWTDGAITKEALTELKEAIIQAGEIRGLNFHGLKDDRKEVIAGGVAVLLGVFNRLGIETMHPVGGALRYGILHDLAGRKEQRDPRASSVKALLTRFSVDEEQADRVSELAGKFFRQLCPKATEEEEKEVYWAAQLHEIGLSVSRSDYHKHSDYLVRNCDIPGFSKYEQEHIATLILGHRGNLKKIYDALQLYPVAEQVFSLRLATILAHARRALPELNIRAGFSGSTLKVSCPKEWLKANPLTEYLLGQEKDNWKKSGFQFELEAL
jgi:exopolyphosphatase/guanosine-5'-triphosphate,3'-diphosphate pyrophosphatase